MSCPTVEAKSRLKRVVRHLVGAKRVNWKFVEVDGDPMIDVFVDFDWRKEEDRVPTSGVVNVGGIRVKHRSWTQKTGSCDGDCWKSFTSSFAIMVHGCRRAV